MSSYLLREKTLQPFRAARAFTCQLKRAVLPHGFYRDYNAAQNILQKSTAGTAGSNAWGEAVYQCPSLNQEALSNL